MTARQINATDIGTALGAGMAGQVLSSDGSTTPHWVTPSSGGGSTSPAGSSGQLQVNSSGSFGAISLGTVTTVLHGNASGAPTWGAVSLANDVTGNLPVANLNSGTGASSSTFWRGDGTWAAPAGGGGGTVSSVSLTVPSFLSVAGSPVTGTGTLAISLVSETANSVLAAPSGSAGTPTFRALSHIDIADWTSATSGFGAGGLTSVGLTMPGIFSVAGSPLTANGTLAVTLATEATNTVLAGPNGSTGAPTFRTLVAADLPAIAGFVEIQFPSATGTIITAGVYDVILSFPWTSGNITSVNFQMGGTSTPTFTFALSIGASVVTLGGGASVTCTTITTVQTAAATGTTTLANGSHVTLTISAVSGTITDPRIQINFTHSAN